MSTLPSSTAMVGALRALSPRALRFLSCRHLQRRSLAESAAHFGISEEAMTIHLLRAMRELSGQLDPSRSRPLPFSSAHAERDAAERLEAACAASGDDAPRENLSGRSAEDAELVRLAALCRGLRDAGPTLARGLEEAERAEFDSPRGRLRERLRLSAIVLLVALTLWMTLR